MTDLSPGLAAIDAIFGEEVLYTGGGLPDATPIAVIWCDVPAGAFQGDGTTRRTVSCEIDRRDLFAEPVKTDRIVRRGVTWRPIDATLRDDVGKWVVTLERAP